MYTLNLYRYKLDQSKVEQLEDSKGYKVGFKTNQTDVTFLYDDLETVFIEIKKHLNNSYGAASVDEIGMRIDNLRKFKKDMLKNNIILIDRNSK